MKYPLNRNIRKIKATVRRKGVEALHPAQKDLYEFVTSNAYSIAVKHYATNMVTVLNKDVKLITTKYINDMINSPEKYAIDDKLILVLRQVFNELSAYQTELRTEVRVTDDDNKKSVLNLNSVALNTILQFIHNFYKSTEMSKETTKNTEADTDELFFLRAKEDITIPELVSMINMFNFAVSPEIYSNLPSECQRHFDKGAK
jgi:hypothetical protein